MCRNDPVCIDSKAPVPAHMIFDPDMATNAGSSNIESSKFESLVYLACLFKPQRSGPAPLFTLFSQPSPNSSSRSLGPLEFTHSSS